MRKWNHFVTILLLNMVGLTMHASLLLAGDKGIVIDSNTLIPGDKVTCGTQCLYLLCRLHGININMDDFLRAVPHNEDGISMSHLKRVAESLGFVCHGYEVDIDELRNLPIPAIAHLKKNHYVLLLSVGSRSVKLVDPPSRLINISHKEFMDEWSGYVLVCTLPENVSDKIEPSKKGEIVYVQNPVWDMGVCPSGNTFNHSFTLVNAGKEDVKILSLKPSCGCVVAESLTECVPAGKTTRFNVALHSAGRSGPYTGQIIIKTDNKNYPILTIKIKAQFKLYKGNLTAFPKNIVWEEVLMGHKATRKIKVMRYGEDPLNLIRATCDIPYMRVDIDDKRDYGDLDSNRYIELEVMVDDKMPKGTFQGTLTVETKHSKYPTIQIPIEGTVVAGIKAKPRSLFLNIEGRSNDERTIVLESVLGEPFKILKTTVDPLDFPGKISYSMIADSSWHVTFKVHGRLPRQIMHGTITVYTDLDDTPRVTIPVTAIKIGQQ